MSTQPLLIDNVAFAKRSERLAGTLLLADCPRLAEMLGSQALNSSASLADKNTSIDNSLINYTIKCFSQIIRSIICRYHNTYQRIIFWHFLQIFLLLKI